MSARPILDTWYAQARARRRTDESCAPLAPQLLGPLIPTLESAEPLARAVIGIVAGRSFTLGSAADTSRAYLDSGHIDLDRSLLARDEALLERLEKWLGHAIHEGAHLRHTPTNGGVRDPLFRAIQNVLEDERIEATIVAEHPEFAHALRSARRDLSEPGEEDANFLVAVFMLVRCEAPVPATLWRRYEARLQAVIEALTPFPTTFDEIRMASLQVALQIPLDERQAIPPPIDDCWIGSGFGGEGQGRWTGTAVEERIRLLRDHRAGECRDDPGSAFRDAVDEPKGYHEVRLGIASRAKQLANRLQLFKPPRRGPLQTTGRIDPRRLHAYSVSPRIFRGMGRKPPSLSVVILIDLSGSMSGRSARIAQEVAILTAEAVRQIPGARLDVFGHHADLDARGSTTIVRFPSNADGRPLGLGRLDVGGNNRDAHAIDLVKEELANSRTSSGGHRIALLIADGAPHADGFTGRAAMHRTRDSILALEREWGPVLYIATDDVDRLRDMVPGPSLRFRSGDVVHDLTRHLTVMLRRSRGAQR